MPTLVSGRFDKKAFAPLNYNPYGCSSISNQSKQVPTFSPEYKQIVEQFGWTNKSSFVICWPLVHDGGVYIPEELETAQEY